MKKILIKLNLLSHLKNAEHFDVMEAIIATTSSLINSFQLLIAAWNNFIAYFGEEDILFKQSQRNEGTQEIEKAEKKRSKLFRLIKQSINLALQSKVESILKAAEILKFLVDIYRDATYVAYTENSALLTNFLQDIATDKYKASVSLLQLDNLIADLKTANDEFKEIYRRRTTEEYAFIDEKLKKARKETDLALQTVAEQTESLYQISLLQDPKSEEVTKLSEIIKIINSHLSKAESIYARRVPSYSKTKEENKEEDIDNPDPTPDPDPEIPVLPIKEQIIESSNAMRLRAVDAEVFNEIFKDSKDGFIRMKPLAESPDITSFKINSFSYDENKNINSILLPPPSKMKFVKPLDGTSVHKVWAEKNNLILAYLDGVLLPEMYDAE